jgi:hypothetical protein
MARKPNQSQRVSLEKAALSKLQIKRFSSLTGNDEAAVKGKNMIDLRELFKFHIDPKLFLFEKICGKVVKKDPVTGVEYPVPFATVHVEDVDLNLITYSPPGFPWVWHFPLILKKEEIGKVKTDACGNFCALVPRFDIDWILKWRTWHTCYPIIFKRPHIDDYIIRRPPFHIPIPEPDPPVIRQRFPLNSIAGVKIDKVKSEMSKTPEAMQFGGAGSKVEKLTNRRLFNHETPAPLPHDFRQALSGERAITSKKATANDAIRSTIAELLKINVKSDIIKAFDHRKLIGPFYRCIDIQLPVWQIIYDVPDITFRVTQDVNGDGSEETIYSEGFFAARWNSGPISNITLVANSIAMETKLCNDPPPESVPCDNIPVLQAADMMALDNSSYFDASTGFAIRPNQPNPSGAVPTAQGDRGINAETPFYGYLNLFGCVNVNVGGKPAVYYRILQGLDKNVAGSPIKGLSWNNFAANGMPVPIIPDADGWYSINPAHPSNPGSIPRNTLHWPTWILLWPTPYLQKTYLQIELGDSSKAHLEYSAKVAIQSDNTVPTITYNKWSWKFVGESDDYLRDMRTLICPMIKRGVIPRDIEVVFEVNISANHLLMANISTSGCGEGNHFIALPNLPAGVYNPVHWHTDVNDNSEILYQRYRLTADKLPGCYSFNTLACSRSITPAAINGSNTLKNDWFYDDYDIYLNPSLSVAVVNENE